MNLSIKAILLFVAATLIGFIAEGLISQQPKDRVHAGSHSSASTAAAAGNSDALTTPGTLGAQSKYGPDVKEAQLLPSWQRQSKLQEIFANWNEGDPLALEAWVKENKQALANPLALRALGGSLANQDVDLVFRLTEYFDNGGKRELLSGYIDNLTDPAAIAKTAGRVATMPSNLVKQSLYEKLGAAWSGADSDGANAWLKNNSGSMSDQMAFAKGFASTLAQSSVEDAMDWIFRQKDNLRPNAVALVLKESVSSGAGAKAIALLMTSDLAYKDNYARRLFPVVLFSDPALAVEMAGQLLPKNEAPEFVQQALIKWNRVDPHSAALWANNNGYVITQTGAIGIKTE